TGMSTALRSVGLLDALSSAPPGPSVATPCSHARLHRLATDAGGKCALERLYLDGRGGGPPELRADLSRFLAWFRARWGGALPRQRDFLFPRPERGSACKRHNLFLRWVVRETDGVDLGLWKAVTPKELVIPLDTHIARMGEWIGLTRRRTRDWRMAEEITAALRAVRPEDPVAFDYPLSRLGILRVCTRPRKGICSACPFAPLCSRRRKNLPGIRPMG
ncbi:MAG: DUF2400 family protein, partial [Thermodesulfobacteriota bacterium]